MTDLVRRHRVEFEFDAPAAMAEDIFSDLLDALDPWGDIADYQWQSARLTEAD